MMKYNKGSADILNLSAAFLLYTLVLQTSALASQGINTLFAIAGIRAVTNLPAAAGCHLLTRMERTTVVIQGLLCFVDP